MRLIAPSNNPVAIINITESAKIMRYGLRYLSSRAKSVIATNTKTGTLSFGISSKLRQKKNYNCLPEMTSRNTLFLTLVSGNSTSNHKDERLQYEWVIPKCHPDAHLCIRAIQHRKSTSQPILLF